LVHYALRACGALVQNPFPPSSCGNVAIRLTNLLRDSLRLLDQVFVDQQSLATSFEVLITAIDASAAPGKQKVEVKELLEEFMAHPLSVEALGDLAEQLRKLLGKTKPNKSLNAELPSAPAG